MRACFSLFLKHRLIRPQSRHLSFDKLAVVYSSSTCPFENLAYEDYLYENVSFQEKRMLYIWRNDPTVVIGRHQNIWKEVNLKLIGENNVALCRRKSGGGSVFHDLGNVNLTFFTDRSNYNRKENLDFIIRVLKNKFKINVSRNEKDDILLNEKYKVSGTAAKLGLKTAYHHCTLLCNTDLNSLSGLLKRSFGDIETNATKSVPSLTANIFESKFDFKSFCTIFADYYSHTYSSNVKLVKIDPIEYPTVLERVQESKRWNWVYGKSPKFTYSNKLLTKNNHSVEIIFLVNKGVITEIKIPTDVTISCELEVISSILHKLVGIQFHLDDILLTFNSHMHEKHYEKQITEWFKCM